MFTVASNLGRRLGPSVPRGSVPLGIRGGGRDERIAPARDVVRDSGVPVAERVARFGAGPTGGHEGRRMPAILSSRTRKVLVCGPFEGPWASASRT